MLVRDLARELHGELSGARLRSLRMDARTREVALFFRDRTVVWSLHPERSGLWLRDAVEPQDSDLRIRARVRGVRSLADERIMLMELKAERTNRGWTLVIELLGNQMNAVVTEGEERIARHVLRTRQGTRPIRVGHPWAPPAPTGRAWVDGEVSPAEWHALLDPVPPPDRARTLVSSVAWTSALNAEACLADAPDEPLGEGLRSWRRLASGREPIQPTILETARGLQPYSLPLPGLDGRSADSLVAAISVATGPGASSMTEGALSIGPDLIERLEETVARLERRAVRLTAELDRRDDPERLRSLGDLVLARYGEIPTGAESVTITDFEGESIELELDPTLAPHENASRYYDRAARSERIAERVPHLIEEARREAEALESLLERARRGEADVEAVRAALPPAPARQKRGPQAAAPPYRVFRSSGGLEIRVGRGARHNDDLTFRHSAPNDVWLHARHTAGAHVILRWNRDGAPPARDLEEAAALAALFSRARTSATVPVDWTRRKHVRKPRKSAPGSVVPDRVQTLFVAPDEGLVEKLAVSDVPGED